MHSIPYVHIWSNKNVLLVASENAFFPPPKIGKLVKLIFQKEAHVYPMALSAVWHVATYSPTYMYTIFLFFCFHHAKFRDFILGRLKSLPNLFFFLTALEACFRNIRLAVWLFKNLFFKGKKIHRTYCHGSPKCMSSVCLFYGRHYAQC